MKVVLLIFFYLAGNETPLDLIFQLVLVGWCGSTRMMVLDLRRVVPGISVDKLNLKERTGVANSNLFSPLV